MKQYSIRFGISSASYFDRMPLDEIITDFGNHGLSECELFLNTWSEYRPDYIFSLKQRIDSLPARLAVNSIHPMSTQFEPQLFSSHPSQSKDAFFIYEQVLNAASVLGAKTYVMHGPIILQHGSAPFSVNRFIPVFKDLSDMASAYGVTLSLENVSWCLFRNPDIGKALSDALGDKLHYTLDIKQAYRSENGFLPESYIDAVGPLIVNVHLCDHIRTENSFKWLLPGKGKIEWSKLLRTLSNVGYKGSCFIESYSNSYNDLNELYASLDYLKNLEY